MFYTKTKTMIRKILTFLILLVFVGSVFSQTSHKKNEHVKRIIFLGNSITYAGQYISYVETYYRLKHPDRLVEWINLGLPSETVSGLSELNHADGAFPRPDLHERLARVLAQLEPDLVFVNYGMNDGIYLPLNEERFQKYKEGIDWLHEQLSQSNAQSIFLTPPIYDANKGEAYAAVLDTYSDWLLSKRHSDSWDVIDIHWPMKSYLQDQRVLDSLFYLAKDGVHPGEIGHWLIAKEILFYLGELDVKDFADIHASIASFTNGSEILDLVEKRQELLRDAWLTSTAHLRPGLPVGQDLAAAQVLSIEIEKQIIHLLHEQK